MWKGIILISISAVCFASYGLWSRLMPESVGLYAQAWIRGVLLLSIIHIYRYSLRWQINHPTPIQTAPHFSPHFEVKSTQISRKHTFWLLLIGLAGGLNQAPYYYALTELPIATATLLFYAGLLLSGICVGVLVLHESINMRIVIAICIGIVGLYIIHPIILSAGSLWPGVAAFVAGSMGGMEISLTKKISQIYSKDYILIVIYSIQVIGNALLDIYFHNSVRFHIVLDFHFLSAIGGYTIAMLVAMMCVIEGFKYVSATLGSIIGLTEVAAAALFGVFIFGEQPSFALVLGSLCIMVATIVAIPRDSSSKLTSKHARIYNPIKKLI